MYLLKRNKRRNAYLSARPPSSFDINALIALLNRIEEDRRVSYHARAIANIISCYFQYFKYQYML